MQKPLTGLFLGAGASYEAGMPLASELTLEIKNWLTATKLQELNEVWHSQGGGYSEVVIKDLVSIMGMNNQHYESILGYIETQAKRKGDFQKEYGQLYSWLVELVYQLLYYRQVNNNQFLARKLDFYSGIELLAKSNQPLWIFSLDHDLIVEAVAAKFSIPLHNGFSNNVISLPRRNSVGKYTGELRAETLSKQDLDHKAMHFPNPGIPGIYLLKIHGALDMFTFNEGADLLKILPEGSSVDAVVAALRAANEELLFHHPESQGETVHVLNEIAYADKTGEMQFLRKSLLAGAYKFDETKHQVLPKSMLKHFRSNLNFVSNLVCIGYSFGDPHINLVMRNWLEFSASRTITIVNPEISDIPGFLLHLALQVKLVSSGATEYLDSVAGIRRSQQDNLEKELTEVTRRIGKEKSTILMNTFSEQEMARISAAYVEKIKTLPIKDGKPNFDRMSDPSLLANTWISEVHGTAENRLERLLIYLKSAPK